MARRTTRMTVVPALTLMLAVVASGQTPAAAPATVVAGIPVNDDESKVGTYTLPDPLMLANGTPVRDARTWFAERRPEIVRMFEEYQYGRYASRQHTGLLHALRRARHHPLRLGDLSTVHAEALEVESTTTQ